MFFYRNPLKICSGLNRQNLYFQVYTKGSNGILNDLKTVMEYNAGAWKFPGSTIVYCITRSQTEEVASILKGMLCKNLMKELVSLRKICIFNTNKIYLHLAVFH